MRRRKRCSCGQDRPGLDAHRLGRVLVRTQVERIGVGANGTWVFGAPEMMLSDDAYGVLSATGRTGCRCGNRVLLLASCDSGLSGETLPSDLRPAALVLLEDQVREDAEETLTYFAPKV